MGRKWLLSLVCLSLFVVLFVPVSNARFDIRINEAATTISFHQLAPKVSLAVENRSGKAIHATVRVELLTPADKALGTIEQNLTIGSGRQKLQINLPLMSSDLLANENQLLWHRLSYELVTDSSGDNTEPIRGIISLSEMTPEFFELRVAGAATTRLGMLYKARVMAVHPISGRPASGVLIRGALSISDDGPSKDTVLTRSATTGREGYVDFEFQLPANMTSNEVILSIEGTSDLITVKTEKEIEVITHHYLLVSTDKPLYQPGQTVHVRAMVLTPSKRAAPAKPVTFKITDPTNTTIFQTEVSSSRFGIASAEWVVPDNTQLGNYDLEVSANEDWVNSSTIRISRYELPNFVVNVKTDRPYYLAGQNATLTVTGDYLFGEPVTRGRVVVVRDPEQTWNYQTQEYETTHQFKHEGELGANRAFSTHVDLAKDFKELQERDRSRFIDLPYTAYVTDLTTNRTEQRRFHVRITKQPIHVYVVRPGDAYEESFHVPSTFYVSTFYADGTPAKCTLTLEPGDIAPTTGKRRPIAQAKTNRYGVAKIAVRLSSDFETAPINFFARDGLGRTGTQQETLDFEDKPRIRVKVPKTIFVPGEAIPVTILSSLPSLVTTLDVVNDWSVIHSEVVRIKNGRASLVLPYRPEFKDEIILTAYADRGREDSISGSRSIIYPRPRALKLNLESSSHTYKPGEDARFTFKAATGEGRGVESALGIVVVDKAVDERVRTDWEGSRYAGFSNEILSLFGDGSAIGSVSRKTIEELDLSKPIPVDLDLVAEVLFNQSLGYFPKFFGSYDYERDFLKLFSASIEAQLVPVRSALSSVYERTRVYPTDESSLNQLLSTTGIAFNSLKDPWGTAYRPLFTLERDKYVLLIKSAGPDETFDTDDDFSVTRLSWSYFRPIGEAIDKAVQSFHERTGGFIRNIDILRDELRREGINLDTLRDPWSKAYTFRFDVKGTHLVINMTTSEPFDDRNYPSNEFSLWESKTDYFARSRAIIDAALFAYSESPAKFPQRRADVREAMKPTGIDLDTLRDPFGNLYYLTFNTMSFYGDQARIEARTETNGQTKQHIEIKPVTSVVVSVKFRSAGADSKQGTQDDFDVAIFSTTQSQQTASDLKPKEPPVLTTFSGSTGAITGILTDAQGAVVAGATVTAKRSVFDDEFIVTTKDEGRYLFRNLPVGSYDLRFEAVGFRKLVMTGVYVRASELLQLDATLEVGVSVETVNVTASAEPVQTTSSTVSSSSQSRPIYYLESSKSGALPLRAPQQLFTPRLREFFPETLVWKPEITTDKKGRAQLEFKLADNITTWKMAVVGSTEDGEVGTAETEIRVFQPFFAELDPPPILTQGDRISLPVVLRNYLDKKQTIDLNVQPQEWFRVLGNIHKSVEVPRRGSITESFELETMATVKDGKQRITALGPDFSDAIQKSVSVHPDGEEKSATASELLDRSTEMFVDLPHETLANSTRVELKIYPNLTSHVWESVEGIMQRPYGCAEQTISSTYPSLLVLRHLKKQKGDNMLTNKAQRYLQAGYQRLLGYQSADGGFGYWAKGDSDIALTAYAVRFLLDASEVIDIDQKIVKSAQQWLAKKQRADGSWPAFNWNGSENSRATPLLTALVARSFARMKFAKCESTSTPHVAENDSLATALDYLQRRTDEIDEPYLAASYSLAATSACEPARAAVANRRLQKLAHATIEGLYWDLETNTPFYGWGLAGRVETTALAVQALALHNTSDADEQQKMRELVDRGLLFLLRNKDRYGVWYSTQATINVLDALLAMLAGKTSESELNQTVDILVNNQHIRTLPLPFASGMAAPIVADLTSAARIGKNRIELKRKGNGLPASAQVVSTYWIPWKHSSSVHSQNSAIQLETTFDKTEARVMEEITCRVKVQRIGFRGYGMLLAEIGLPPGADVDRSSLEKAMKEQASISQYDVLPDRVVLYLWPRASGTSFGFKFRPRMPINAQSSSAFVYDYYNPEAKAVVAPTRFIVK